MDCLVKRLKRTQFTNRAGHRLADWVSLGDDKGTKTQLALASKAEERNKGGRFTIINLSFTDVSKGLAEAMTELNQLKPTK